jgi:putative endonuclease
MSKGYMYILECADLSYYTGSTKDLERRLWEHQNMLGANYTKKRLPVKLLYYEEYSRIDEAFYREKQVQGWSRKKKEALIKGENQLLPKLAKKIFRDKTVASIKSPSAITQPTADVKKKTARLLSSPDSSGRIETTVTQNLKKVAADE